MKKYLLKKHCVNPKTGNVVPVKVNGEKVEFADKIFDETRKWTSRIQDISTIEPLLVEILKTDNLEDIEIGKLFDHMTWNTHEPLGYPFLVISNQFKKLLLKFNHQKIQFYNTTLIFNLNKIENYEILQFIDLPFLDFVDYSKTLFQNGAVENMFKPLKTPKTPTKVNSRNDLQIKIIEQSWPDYEIHSLSVLQSFWENDFMFVRNKGVYVSERFKIEFEKSSMTGFKFTPIDLGLI